MSKNSCLIEGEAVRSEGLLKKVAQFFTGSQPESSAATTPAKRGPRPVLYRLPDLRKFGPSIN